MKRYSWTVSLVVVAVCSMLAARAFGLYLVAGNESNQPGPVIGQVRALPALPAVARDISRILERNPFCSTCPRASAAVTPAAASQGDTSPLQVPANLRLLATIISDEPGWSFAAVQDTDSARTALYTEGSLIPGVARVDWIAARRVALEQDGRRGILALDPALAGAGDLPTADASAAATPDRSGLPAVVRAGIRRVGEGRFEVVRPALERLLNNTVLVARSGLVTPNAGKGGFTLRRLREGGLYELLGFSDGDSIHAVNGRAITTPESVLPIYQNLRRASHISIGFSRRGKPMTHDYTIR